MRVVTASLLTTEKLSVSFCSELLNTWVSLVLQENAFKTLSKQSVISDCLLRVNCSVNFDDLDNLAVDSNMFRLLLREIS